MKSLITAFMALFVSVSAHAAEFSVDSFETSGNTFISMDGQTVEGDHTRLESAISEAWTKATANGKTFSGIIFLTGPGGNAYAGMQTAEVVRKNRLTTVAWKDCISACSLIWTAGTSRHIDEDTNATVQFHPPYHTDSEFFHKTLDLYGIIGIQDQYGRIVIDFLAQYFEYGINNPAAFMKEMSSTGPGHFFVLTNDNIHIVN